MNLTIKPALSGAANAVDKSIRLVLTERGPEYWSLEVVERAETCRRVRKQYYTHGFADIVFREFLMCNAKMNAVLFRVLLRVSEAGSELGNLLSTHVRDWWPIVEDARLRGAAAGLSSSG